MQFATLGANATQEYVGVAVSTLEDSNSTYRLLGAKGSYLTLVRVADRIL